MTQEYFSISLSLNTSLAIPLTSIGKVIQLEVKNICAVPGISDFWYGVTNFRGSLLWVLDSDRYFSIHSNQQNISLKKLASVVVKHYSEGNLKQVAIATPKLEGIITIEPQQLEPITNSKSANLKDCCDHIISDRDQHIYILNSAKLLAQLHHQSALLSV